MVKSAKRYRAVFESLMDYTDFKDSSEIKSKQDLKTFFEQVEADARGKGNTFRTSQGLFNAIANEVVIGSQSGQPVVNPTVKALRSRNTYTSVKMAKDGDGLVNYKGKKIFKSSFSKNKTVITKWRDSKGRFTKKPKLEDN